jgi:DNA-binding response OmpR family regulator
MKIVLVEDSPDLCEVWTELLELEGHQVRTFLDGKALLKEARAIHWCDAVVTDYYLPDLNGVELVGHIRVLRNDVPVILLSGMRDSSVVKMVQQMPRTAYLPKPAEAGELEATLRRLVPGQSRADAEALATAPDDGARTGFDRTGSG